MAPPTTSPAPVIKLVDVGGVALMTRGQYPFNIWLHKVMVINMNPFTDEAYNHTYNRSFRIPCCPMKIAATAYTAINHVHADRTLQYPLLPPALQLLPWAPILENIAATLIDLRVADLKAFHTAQGTPLTAIALWNDLLTPPVLPEDTARLDGMKTKTIVKLRTHALKVSKWTVNQVAMFVGTMWAWDEAPDAAWSRRRRLGPVLPTDDWGCSKDTDPRIRHIYELVRHYDPHPAQLRPACGGCRELSIPKSLFHPLFSRVKCVVCFLRNIPCVESRK